MNTYFLTEKELFLTFFACLLGKFMLFNFLWCNQTTFTPFSSVELYVNSFLCVLVILMPFIIVRAAKVTLLLSFLLDLLFISNLMYFRTYYTAIPLESYGLLGNLQDFTDSVWDAMRLPDLGFLLFTAIPLFVWWKKYRPAGRCSVAYNKRTAFIHTTVIVFLLFTFSAIPVIADNGYRSAYEKLKKSNKYSCTTPMYTVFGTLLYEYLEGEEEYTPAKESEIESWLSSNRQNYLPVTGNRYPENLIIILAESFESWVLEKKIEGKEITPRLNSLIKDSTTLYASRVLSQVKGGALHRRAVAG
ncbi:MAG: hypothetical protein LUD74_01975 [Tannerellaceae bacterium]|nr:hypothetical protein [Tannerellaceae bacterium]